MFDRHAIVAAYYHVASRYHSGQTSTGYRKLSQCARIGFRPGLARDLAIKGSDLRREMATLIWTRRREIARRW